VPVALSNLRFSFNAPNITRIRPNITKVGRTIKVIIPRYGFGLSEKSSTMIRKRIITKLKIETIAPARVVGL
jgi:hypothetical protein